MNIIRTWWVYRAPTQPGEPPFRLPRMEVLTVYPDDVTAEIAKWRKTPPNVKGTYEDYRVEAVLTREEEARGQKRQREADRRKNAHAEAVRREILRLRENGEHA